MSSPPAAGTRSSSVTAEPPPLTASTTATAQTPMSRRSTTQQITLIDCTRPGDPEIQNPGELPDDDDDDDDDSAQDEPPLSRRWTAQSMQRKLASRKYRGYREERFIGPDDAEETAQEAGRMRRGKNRVRGLLKTKRQMQLALEEDAVIDVLYENQRGWWVWGVPHYSSKTLLNFDPKPWLNGHKKPSPVNITNAQVPDPHWEWAWKSWYVDMSRDVDEEGWEYSFWFSEGTSWHGTHPWGHSWVRRRRWLRKRVRKHANLTAGQLKSGHALSPDYFTIHPSSAASRNDSFAAAQSPGAKDNPRVPDDYAIDPANVRDIATLLAALKRAAVDREKLVLVRHFVDNGGEDLYYLDTHMDQIMSLCIFQNSRRQILTTLMHKFEAAQQHRKEHQEHNEEEQAPEHNKIENLLKAVAAADEQVKRLEYWSDVRDLARKGNTLGATDDEAWPVHEWTGLDSSGPEADKNSTAKEKGKSGKQVRKEAESQLRPKDSGWGSCKGKSQAKGGELADTSEEAVYTTAEEEPRDKGKGRADE